MSTTIPSLQNTDSSGTRVLIEPHGEQWRLQMVRWLGSHEQRIDELHKTREDALTARSFWVTALGWSR